MFSPVLRGRLQTDFVSHPLSLNSSLHLLSIDRSSSSMSATTKLSPVSNKEKKMKLKKRGMDEPRRDTIRKRIKRCETRTNPCGSNRKEQEKEGRWSELPYEILDMIVKRIYFIDLINLRAVCQSWHYSFTEFQPLKKVPWLMTLDDLPSVNSSCKLIDPTYKRTYIVNDTKIKEKKLYDMEVHDSKCGWVLMSSQSCRTSGTFFLLYTPFFTENNVIELPVLNSKFHIATFSSAPSFGTTQDDCVFLAYDNSASGEVSICTCRRGDHTWRTRHLESYFPLSKVMSVVYSQGVFYCPSHDGSIGSFNVDRDEWVVLEPKKRSRYFKDDLNCVCARMYLLKSDDDREFFLVFMWMFKEVRRRPSIAVYRLDRSKMIWKWLRSLGDRALFITKGTSVAMELPKWKDKAFLCRNRKVMYFQVPVKQNMFDRCYPCTKLYGSYDGQKQIWIEPPL